MNLFGKRLEEVTEADLRSLVENRVRESLYVEYKREMHRSSDEQKREFLKDVSALANAQGGHLIIGVAEADGYPTEILGIDEAERGSQAAIQLCNTCIQERLQGLKVVPVELSNGKSVLVIEVPPSIRKPTWLRLGGKPTSGKGITIKFFQ